MPFGLTNAPSTFICLMNHVLRDCIGRFFVIYFDDMLVYNTSLSGHIGHLRVVLSLLRVNQLYANIDKCTYCVDNVVFLGFVVNKNGVHVDPEKIKVIREWAIPKIVRDIRSSHGLAGFYEGSYPTSLLLHHP